MTSRGTKRARGAQGQVIVRSRRPIVKELKVISQTLSTSQTATTLKTTTFPCTILGVRWSFNFHNTATTQGNVANWAIVVVPDGESANTIATSDGADFYTPEQNVIAFGILFGADNDIAAGPQNTHVEGSTKTMRKLKQGDVLQVIASAEAAGNLRGVVQFFCKI